MEPCAQEHCYFLQSTAITLADGITRDALIGYIPDHTLAQGIRDVVGEQKVFSSRTPLDRNRLRSSSNPEPSQGAGSVHDRLLLSGCRTIVLELLRADAHKVRPPWVLDMLSSGPAKPTV